MLKLLSVLAVATVTTSAFAINLQSYRFTDSYRYSILDDSLAERFSGKYVLTTSLAHIHSPLLITNGTYSTVADDVVKHSDYLTVGFSYYFSDSFTLGFETMGLVNKEDNDHYSFFIGDTIVKSKINFFRQAGFSFSVNPQLFLPTGNPNGFAGVKELAAGVSVVGEKQISKLHLLASAGYFSGNENQFDVIDYRDLILTQIGVSYDINQDWNANIEAYRNFVTDDKTNQDEGTYAITAKNKTTESISTYFGAGVAGFSDLDRDNYTIFAGLKYSEPAAKIPEPKPEIIEAPREVKEAPAKITKRDDEKNLGVLDKITHVYFQNNSSELFKDEAARLDMLLVAYKANPDIKHIVIEGYASKRGTHTRNLVLSEERAVAVKEYLYQRGIPAEKLSVVAYGDAGLKQYPLEGQNRRVEFRVYK